MISVFSYLSPGNNNFYCYKHRGWLYSND